MLAPVRDIPAQMGGKAAIREQRLGIRRPPGNAFWAVDRGAMRYSVGELVFDAENP